MNHRGRIGRLPHFLREELNSGGVGHRAGGPSNVASVACGSFHSLAVCSNGTVIAWGNNDLGQTNVPPGLSNVVAVAEGRGTAWRSRATGRWWRGATTRRGKRTSRQD